MFCQRRFSWERAFVFELLLKLSHIFKVKPPQSRRPTDDEFFSSSDRTKPDLAFLKQHFFDEGRLTESQALYIIRAATELFKNEPNVLELDIPLTGMLHSFLIAVAFFHAWTVCGDIHGQYVRKPSPIFLNWLFWVLHSTISWSCLKAVSEETRLKRDICF